MLGAVLLTFFLNTPFATVEPGQTTTFYGLVGNSTNVPIRDARLHLEFPAALKLVSWTIPGWDCAATDTTVDCRAASVPASFVVQFHFDFAASDDPNGGVFTINATLTSADDPAGQSAREVVYVTRHITVRSAADSGPDTLRDAIGRANAACASSLQQCTIDFDLPQGSEIVLASPLPEITGSVLVDGNVVVSGAHLDRGNGFTARPGGRPYFGIRLRGLTIRDFPENGVDFAGDVPAGATCSIQQCVIEGNGLRGVAIDAQQAIVDIHNNTIVHNGRSGVAIWSGSGGYVNANTIEWNGAAGVYIGKVISLITVTGGLIAFNQYSGVGIDPSACCATVYAAAIAENLGDDVDWGIDGNNAPATESGPLIPTLLGATYDAAKNETTVSGELRGSTHGNFVHIIFYASNKVTRWGVTPMTNMYPSFAFARTFNNNDEVTPFAMTLSGDYRGAFISAQSAVQPFPDYPVVATSELSRAIRVPK